MSKKTLIKNGRIFDGEKFFRGDVAIEDEKIVAVGDTGDFKPTHPDLLLDAKGNIVCPGLVDVHTHLKPLSSKDFQINAEAVCFPNGVTAAGEACAMYCSPFCDCTTLRIKLFAFLDIVGSTVDFSHAEQVLNYYGGRAIGIKIFFEKNNRPEVLSIVTNYAREHGLKVMVHSSNPPIPMRELVSKLSPGDICTHVFHGVGNTVSSEDYPYLRKAQERGVVLDAAIAGGVHTDFNIAGDAVAAGVYPDTLSTDITKGSAYIRCGGTFGLLTVMSIFLHLGMPEEEVLRAVTSRAAKAISLENECGKLEPGRAADIAVIGIKDKKIRAVDRNAHVLSLDKGYSCLLTVSDGNVVYRSEDF